MVFCIKLWFLSIKFPQEIINQLEARTDDKKLSVELCIY